VPGAKISRWRQATRSRPPHPRTEVPLEIRYITQPNERVGDLIDAGFIDMGVPAEFVLVSAFASLPTVLRMKSKVEAVRDAGGDARLVLGVDLGGTSKEVLQEVAGWSVPVTIVKNRFPGITFHPKLYLLRWITRAEIFVGSNNLTEGGFYRNSEASSRTTYVLPHDAASLTEGVLQLDRFLKPSGPTASALTPAYLATLLALPEIPSEAQARRNRAEGAVNRPDGNQSAGVFGSEFVAPPPKLPPELQKLLLAARNHQQSEFKKAIAKAKQHATKAAAGLPVVPVAAPVQPPPLAQLDPTYYFMSLPAMQGDDNPNIPGEPRIPLEAIEMAEDFWGWPDNYEISISPRKGADAKEPRIYRNWKPMWRIYASDNHGAVAVTPVRMYFYENSKDFRFYAGELIRLQAASGDIVRLQRVDEPDATYECVLARSGSPEHAAWTELMVNQVQSGNSQRRFGFT
jgi:hypothetical protein